MDKSLAARHVELLTLDAGTACNFRLIHDKDKSQPARKLYGTLDTLWPEIAEAQAEGYGVFVIPNSGGDTDAEIKSVRALFIDMDGAPLPETFHLPPSFIVQRDATHWHAYWLCYDLPVADFATAQKRLIARYGSDKTIHNPSRVMRLAGSDHHKGDPIPITLTEGNTDPLYCYYTSGEVLDGLPPPAEAEATVRDVADNVELDTTANVARAQAYVKTLPLMRADVGEHTDDYAIEVCRKLGDLGVSEVMAGVILYDDWGRRCEFDQAWIETKASNAYKGRENALGVDAVQTASAAFGASLTALLPPKPEFPRFYFYSREEFANWREPSWLVPNVIPEQGVCLWFGKPGSYKSFLALDLALSLSYGLPVYGYDPGRPRRVAYIAGESPHGITSWRVPAWEMGHDVSGRSSLFRLAKNMPLATDPAAFLETVEQIKAQSFKPELLVLDTVSTAMAGLDDSSFKDVSNFMAGLRMFRDQLGCAVLAIHHTKKDGSGERGSGAFVGDADAVAEISAWSETRAAAIQMKKVRDAELRATPWTFQGTQIAKALVFHPTSAAEHADLTQQADAFSRAIVGKALLGAGALGRSKAIQTAVVADLLIPPQRHETPEQRKENIGRACGVLNKLARSSLRAYCDTTPKGDYVWFLPGE